jgi:hypothetical protein
MELVNEHGERDETFWAPGTLALEDSKDNPSREEKN